MHSMQERERTGDNPLYHPERREFSRAEGSSRGTHGVICDQGRESRWVRVIARVKSGSSKAGLMASVIKLSFRPDGSTYGRGRLLGPVIRIVFTEAGVSHSVWLTGPGVARARAT